MDLFEKNGIQMHLVSAKTRLTPYCIFSEFQKTRHTPWANGGFAPPPQGEFSRP